MHSICMISESVDSIDYLLENSYNHLYAILENTRSMYVRGSCLKDITRKPISLAVKARRRGMVSFDFMHRYNTRVIMLNTDRYKYGRVYNIREALIRRENINNLRIQYHYQRENLFQAIFYKNN